MFWISPSQLAQLARIKYRPATRAISQALRRGRPWRMAKLIVREKLGRGGAGGRQLEVRLDSLPPELQRRHAELQASGAPSTQPIGAEPGQAGPGWTPAERELRHDEFSRLPATLQKRAHRAAAAVSAFQALAGSALSMQQRYMETAVSCGVSIPSVRAWVKRCAGHASGDWPMMLAYHHKGAPPRAPISPAAWDFIEREYLQLSKPALKAIYERARRLAREHGWVLPSYATVRRLVEEKIPRPLLILKREGREAYERLYSGGPRDYSTLKLHEVWCADGHKADVWVRMEDGSVVRPVIVSWEELRTRLMVSATVVRVESAEAVLRSFGAALEKARAVPEYAYLDNGRGFASKLFTGGAETRHRFKITDDEPPGALILIGVKPLWARPYNAKAKPIESFHRLYTEMAKRFPGAYCGNNPGAKPEDADPAKAVPIAEFRAVLAEEVAAYNARPHRGDAMHGRSPLQVYEALLPAAIVRQPTKNQIRLCLMARQVVKLGAADSSITVLGNRYWANEILALSRRPAYVASYDPEDATQPIALYTRDGSRFLLDVPLQKKTGFRSAQAAKERASAARKFRRATEDADAARRAMREAGRWTVPQPQPNLAPEAPLPSAKVARIDVDPRFKRRGDARVRVSLSDALAAEFKVSGGGKT